MTTEPEVLETNEQTRPALVRMAVMYVPLALISTVFAIYAFGNFMSGATGAIIPAIFVGIFAFSFATLALSAIRDLRGAEPITSRGPVRRTWSRGGLLWFFRSHYLYVGNDVFTVRALTAVSLHPGDSVEVDHWPHTKHVLRVRLLSTGSGDTPSEPAPAAPSSGLDRSSGRNWR
ncbi:MAG: hypothetical protein DWI48_00120 [Chloroflexi bacterium]|nr:MAG: hypothetical protein DWI48_00120 [Chloroflexota bacterium]